MSYKWFFVRIWRLITAPTKTWQEIADEQESKNFFGDYFYPLIGFCGLLLFGVSLFNKWIAGPGTAVNLMVQEALLDTVGIFVAFIGGLFLAVWAIRKIGENFMDIDTSGQWLPLLVGYSMTVPILLQTTAGIFSSFILLQWIFQFYTLYIVWEGSKMTSVLKDTSRLSFSIMTTVVLIAIPHLISFVFGILMH